MKVGIVAASNIRFSPYIYFYTNILDEYRIDYEVIFPNRENVKDNYQFKAHEMPWNSRFGTLVAYYLYCFRVRQLIKLNNYDFLIVLTSNNAVFLAPYLKEHYSNKYIVDIRDFSHENIKMYYHLEKCAITHAKLNIISSRRFERFLPKENYSICHNFFLPQIIQRKKEWKKRLPITIGYIGKGGYLENCKMLCGLIKNDPRFSFEIYGMDEIPNELKEYTGIKNIHFRGKYTPDKKQEIIEKLDILFNIYGHGTPLLDYAISNKLYDAFVFIKPILTSPDTYMSEMAGPFGFSIDFSEHDVLNKLYDWYTTIDYQVLEEYSQKILSTIRNENNETKEKIVRCIIDK